MKKTAMRFLRAASKSWSVGRMAGSSAWATPIASAPTVLVKFDAEMFV